MHYESKSQVPRWLAAISGLLVFMDTASDLPPLKWSSLKYVLTLEDEINGEEAAYG